MRIAIDAYPLARNGTGISNYLYNLVKQLEQIDLVNEYYLYSCPGIKLPFSSNPRWHIRIKKGVINKSATLWMQILAKKDLAYDKIDIFWSPEQMCPLNLPKKIKLLLTIHDLSNLYFPQTMSVHNLILHRLFFRKSVQKADILITDSNSIAMDIKKNFVNINNEKIKMIYCAATEEIELFNIKESMEYLHKKLNFNKKFILFVGTIEPRKNIETLIEAYYELDKNIKDELMLVIAGKFGWKISSVFNLCRKLGLSDKQVKFLGCVPMQDLSYLYSAASLFVFPSLYEGFGMPLLEAMKCGTPILCSDISVFREVAKDSAYFVEPKNVAAMSMGIKKLLSDQYLVSNLTSKGLERCKLFSWGKSAKELLEIFKTFKYY